MGTRIIRLVVLAASLTAVAAVPGRGQAVSGILPDPILYANEVFRLTNIARVAANPRLRPFVRSAALDLAATGWSGEMAAGDFLSHVPPGVAETPKNISDAIRARLIAAGYNPQRWAENVAEGFDFPQDAVDAFMDSPVHRVNILNKKLKDFGVGVVFLLDGFSFLTENFGTLRRTRRAFAPGRLTAVGRRPVPSARALVLFESRDA